MKFVSKLLTLIGKFFTRSTSVIRKHPILLFPFMVALVVSWGMLDSVAWLALVAIPLTMLLGNILREWEAQPAISAMYEAIVNRTIGGPSFLFPIPAMFAVDRVCIPGMKGSYKVKYPIRGYATILVSCVSDGYLYYYRTYPYMDGSKHNTLRAVKGMLLRIEVVSYDEDTPVKSCIGAIPLNLQIEWLDRPPDLFEESLKPLTDELSDEIDRDAMERVRKMMENANADVVGMAPSPAMDMCAKVAARLTDEEIKRFKETLD